jgi:hypothetical protein
MIWGGGGGGGKADVYCVFIAETYSPIHNLAKATSSSLEIQFVISRIAGAAAVVMSWTALSTTVEKYSRIDSHSS